MMLKHCHEILGTLVKVEEKDGLVKASFDCRYKVEFPKSGISKEKLEKYLYQDIGVINIYDEYRIRKLKTSIDEFKEKECEKCQKSKQKGKRNTKTRGINLHY